MARTLNKAAPDEFLAVLRALPEKDGVHVFPDKGWLQEQGGKVGKTAQWGAAMLASMEERGKVQRVRQGRAITGVVLLQPTLEGAVTVAAEPQPAKATQPEAEQPQALRDRLVALLQRRSDERGKVPHTVDEIRDRLKADRHDTIKALYDLKRRGQLTFRETGGSGKSKNLVGFRLQGDLMPTTAPVDNALAPWSICPQCYWDRKFHRRGTGDRTVLICPTPAKAGSPLWAKQTGEGYEKAGEDAPTAGLGDKLDHAITQPAQRSNLRHAGKPKPGPVTRYYQCFEKADGKECGQRFSDPVGLRMHKDAKHVNPDPAPQNLKPVIAAGEALLQAMDAQVAEDRPPAAQQGGGGVQAEAWADRADAYVAGLQDATRPPDWAQYPLLTEVARVYHARVQARALLEAAGDSIPGQFLHAGIGAANTGGRVAEEITRLLAALGYEGVNR